MAGISPIVIVDYGAGNLRSVERAVAHAGVQPLVTALPDAIKDARALIVPGVGAAEDTMTHLREGGLAQPIIDYIASGRPFLGVCMGMQALFDLSEEGGRHECLGVLPGRIVRFPFGMTVPHMGWNTVHLREPHPLFEGVAQDSYFYFVHSYHPSPDDRSIVIAETEYEGITFPSVVGRNNVVATQFHPEKSGEDGLRLYANFVTLALEAESASPARASVES
ncbi:MAG: imidazole glycerol phosphate synthase subunit HisH [Chloroflexi bacterium]|nr:imidazole glycerol phosphate synthase subunit HisH [Chloroflexota bacterium]MDA1003950.1 imidazole glycerol phosphate synthase subunit HisH [Chloroflexota bacterium]